MELFSPAVIDNSVVNGIEKGTGQVTFLSNMPPRITLSQEIIDKILLRVDVRIGNE